ncbi:MAG TPA: [protein-PII] uridylyltransferase [Candidatus Dormibacteraeota bacterium]|nr:[protein-PII] uridylyltransferase [Candidatus Dormibacteraeota bacterium]
MKASSPIPHPILTGSTLREWYGAELARISGKFDRSGNGSATASARAALLDQVIGKIHGALLSSSPSLDQGLCIAAIGGYGRRALFPQSDVDLLLLCENGAAEKRLRPSFTAISQALWDLPVRVSPATRTLDECGRFNSENAEFTISLLDCRPLAGDLKLFGRLHDQVIPKMVAREQRDLLRMLHQLVRERHAKHGNTIFGLEPNIKDSPGGLRDYAVARSLALVSWMGAQRAWAEPESLWPAELREQCLLAFDFLAAARCFLHYRCQRDDNSMTYESQDEAASRAIGLGDKQPISAADWMRHYFRKARSIDRLTNLLIEESVPEQSSLYATFEGRRTRLSNADFQVAREQIFLANPSALADRAFLLRPFEFMARHGLSLSGEAQRQIEHRVADAAGELTLSADIWTSFRQILLLPGAAPALRAMHACGLLVALLPEFKVIDALVTRDFYHRYTVDEHSFMTVENLHRLRRPGEDWEQKYREILDELEQPELLFFALLLHDVGKGMAGDNHVQGSLQAARQVLARLALPSVQAETVLFLIANHLEMSRTLQRRDIFNPEEIRSFSRRVGAPERLKMLCLFTYADIRSVNPEALTPWKAEMLWQLYAATENHLNRAVDEERFHAAGAGEQQLKAVSAILPGNIAEEEIAAFLEGFPERYLASHSPEEIATHLQMSRRLAQEPFQIEPAHDRDRFTLTLLTRDRPRLLATTVGTLYGWGMSIVKAEAFASTAGIALDTFHFIDLFRTLELNPSERERFRQSLIQTLSGQQSLEAVLAKRSPGSFAATSKIDIPTQIRFDDTCSSLSSVLELVAADRPGLLYQVASLLSELGCNIEVALIDTEGPKAIDVFYLTAQGLKLDPAREEAIEKALLSRIG